MFTLCKLNRGNKESEETNLENQSDNMEVSASGSAYRAEDNSEENISDYDEEELEPQRQIVEVDNMSSEDEELEQINQENQSDNMEVSQSGSASGAEGNSDENISDYDEEELEPQRQIVEVDNMSSEDEELEQINQENQSDNMEVSQSGSASGAEGNSDENISDYDEEELEPQRQIVEVDNMSSEDEELEQINQENQSDNMEVSQSGSASGAEGNSDENISDYDEEELEPQHQIVEVDNMSSEDEELEQINQENQSDNMEVSQSGSASGAEGNSDENISDYDEEELEPQRQIVEVDNMSSEDEELEQINQENQSDNMEVSPSGSVYEANTSYYDEKLELQHQVVEGEDGELDYSTQRNLNDHIECNEFRRNEESHSQAFDETDHRANSENNERPVDASTDEELDDDPPLYENAPITLSENCTNRLTSENAVCECIANVNDRHEPLYFIELSIIDQLQALLLREGFLDDLSHPQHRQKEKMENMILAGLWFGSSDPLVNYFLYPLYNQLAQLRTGIHVEVPKSNRFKTIKALILCGTCDAIARSDFLNHIRFNGDYGCTRCFSKGYTIREEGVFGNTHIYPFEGEFLNRDLVSYETFSMMASTKKNLSLV
ncbi:interaptin-like [Chelonus insularis]|uniref:interaptin-like n=1 Tax=Chelonus insularis TaxID=460826 RepID=UPI00158B6898|nr:interaptin-like [Chelonus insularis]